MSMLKATYKDTVFDKQWKGYLLARVVCNDTANRPSTQHKHKLAVCKRTRVISERQVALDQSRIEYHFDILFI